MSPKPLIYTLATVIMVVVVVSLLYKPFLSKQEHTSEAHSTVADTREALSMLSNGLLFMFLLVHINNGFAHFLIR